MGSQNVYSMFLCFVNPHLREGTEREGEKGREREYESIEGVMLS